MPVGKTPRRNGRKGPGAHRALGRRRHHCGSIPRAVYRSLCSYMELSRDKPMNTGPAGDSTPVFEGVYERLDRFGKAKVRGYAQGCWIVADGKGIKNQYVRARQCKVGEDVKGCATHLIFHHYLASDTIRLARVHTCKRHTLCPVCAILRAGKSLRRYVEAIAAEIEAGAVPFLVTHTVKNSDDLKGRARHVLTSYRKMVNLRKDYRRYGRGEGWQLAGVEGGLYSLEVKRGQAGGWHPHAHGLWLLPAGTERLDAEALKDLWRKLTKDSDVVNVRRVTDKGEGLIGACLEVLKYAVKFGEMTFEDNWQASQDLKGLRLTASFGSLYGVKEAESGPDEIEEGDEPYIEYVARWGGVRYSFERVSE